MTSSNPTHHGVAEQPQTVVLRRLRVLDLLARLGAATPRQLAALLENRPAKAVSSSTVLRIEALLGTMAREGQIRRETVRTPAWALRSDEQPQLRLSPKALHELPSLRGEARRVCLAVHEAGGASGWVDEAEAAALAYPKFRDPRKARYRLRQLTRAGWLLVREGRPREMVEYALLTRGGERSLRAACAEAGRRSVEPARPPRPDQAAHHLLAVEAGIRLVQAAGGEFQGFAGDESLRSALRAGRKTTAGAPEAPIPDGRVWYRRDGRGEYADIEILVSKYSDAQIDAKYEGLGPLGVQFFAPTETLVRRVQELGHPAPHLLR